MSVTVNARYIGRSAEDSVNGRQQYKLKLGKGFKSNIGLSDADVVAGVVRRNGGVLYYAEDSFLKLGPENWNTANVGLNGESSQVSTGVYRIYSSAGSYSGVSSGTYVVGKTYLIELTVDSVTTAGVGLQLEGFGNQAVAATVGKKTYVLAATGTINVIKRGSGATDIQISSISVREILSASLYQDTAGTLPSYLSSTVGLQLDRSYGGAMGSELVTNGGFDSGITGWTPSVAGAASVAASGGSVRVQSSGTDTASFVQTPGTSLVVGNYYEITLDVTITSGGGYFYIGSTAAANQQAFAASGVKVFRLPAGNSFAYYGVSRTSGQANDFLVNSISVKEVLGNHATQSTTANKPTVVRGLYNLLTWSGDFSNAAWSNGAISTIGNKIAADTTSSWHSKYRYFTAVSGSNCTIAFDLSAAEYTKARFADASSGEWYLSVDLLTGAVSSTGGARFVSATTERVSGRVVVAVVVSGNGVAKNYGVIGIPDTGVTLGIYGAQYTGDNTSGIYLNALGWIQGTLTASQIIANGGIPLTTSSAGWNQTAGKYALSHNGTSQFLQLATNPIGATLSQPYTIVVSGTVGALGANMAMCGDAARVVRISSAGKVNLVNSGNPSAVESATTYSQGTPLVIEATWDGTTAKVWVNGVLEANSAYAAPTTASGAFMIGQRGNGAEYWNDTIAECFATNSVIPDADRKQIARAAAIQAGCEREYIYGTYIESGNPSLDLDFTSQNYNIWGGI